MKLFRVLCVLALATCLTAVAYAETQSVKVSGDLTIRGLLRDDYNFRGSANEPDVARTGITSNTQTWFMSAAEVEIDADLTDNVQTVIRLANQRDLNVQTKSITSATTLAQNGLGGYTANANEFNIVVELTYLTLK